jgi:starch synthase
MKKILFASSEAVPFIKTGGLADVAGSLPKYFPKSEYDVRVVLPKYMCMDHKYCDEMKLITECQVHLNWRVQYAGVYELKEKGITYYFIDNEYYFAGPAPYGEIYQDAEKFAYFSKAVLTILPEIDFQPDIIHCHDWQTGLVPVFLEAQFRKDEFYHYIKTIFTIHNLKFQGRWYIDAIRDATGLDASYFTMDKLESYGNANLLKGGVVFADYVTTVSETYAKEIQSSEGGEGLDGLLRTKNDCLSGIVNGLDYTVFDPANDPSIAQQFTGDVLSYKKANKLALQKATALNEASDVFLIGIVSRLTDQKGFDLIDYILDEILSDERIQMVVLGTGEQRYEDMFRYYENKYPGRVSANIRYSEDFAHQIYASCDAFLMPSLFEPCGLSQLMSLRYGTVPMVRETGGLKDTVEPYNEFEHTGNGFCFHNYNAHEMLYMVRYACKIFYQEPDEWRSIIARGMALDYSWGASSEKYAMLYDVLCAKAEEEKKADIARAKEQKRLEQERLDAELLARIRLEKTMTSRKKKKK